VKIKLKIYAMKLNMYKIIKIQCGIRLLLVVKNYIMEISIGLLNANVGIKLAIRKKN
jgi:hypothetical protein